MKYGDEGKMRKQRVPVGDSSSGEMHSWADRHTENQTREGGLHKMTEQITIMHPVCQALEGGTERERP
jgi:hypothetical protein